MIKREKSPQPPFTKGGINSEAGFSLVELLITMVVFVLVIAAASQVFTGLLTQFKQQSKIAETNIEGIVGLEILRRDIEHAGYGLPWNGLIAYSESSSNPFNLNDATTGTPRAIISQNNVTTYSAPNDIFNGSDYLVIKSLNVARNSACEKWTTLSVGGPTTWTPDRENVNKKDDGATDNNIKVIVISPGGTSASTLRSLISSGSAFSTTYGNITTSPWPPTNANETRIVYGLATSDVATPIRPFNRADYFIQRPATNMPSRCAPNTGILYKATMNHDTNGNYNLLPLLDCVADMQVVYQRDTDGDGTIDNTTDDISVLTAQQIREQVKEARVYILAHEGQRDVNYTHTPTTIYVGDSSIGSGHNFIIGTNVNYRWKLYTIVAKPDNLR
jgi:prepilin-type N-terminal cleavage/methylation domain-containing protein